MNTFDTSGKPRSGSSPADTFASRLPRKLFDFHTHLASPEHLNPVPPLCKSGPQNLTELAAHHSSLVGPNRVRGALCMGFPTKYGDLDAANTYVAGQIADRDGYVMNLLVSPKTSKDVAEEWIDSNKVVGFKPYHCYAPREDTFHCEIDEFLPTWVWELADKHCLLITLHLVKNEALSDRTNLKYIRDHCERYPNANLVLAHAGRGFNARNTTRGIHEYRHLQNLWFDSAAICEASPFAAIIEAFGPRRLLWGTDFPISTLLGRCVSMGNGFAWVSSDNFALTGAAFHGEPISVGAESVNALIEAIDLIGLDDRDTVDIFYDNALRILGLDKQPKTQTENLYKTAKTRIPAGTQLLSKRPEMFAPGQWPAYFREARGCEVWDIDGRHFFDVSIHGIGASLLGYRHPDVTKAVVRRVQLGSFSTLNPPEEVELAEVLCDIHPWAEQVRFARTGGEIMSVAIRIARATTDRSMLLVCGYHGWHDWYLAANLGDDDALDGLLLPGLDPTGVPRELRGTTLTFMQNDIDRFDLLMDEYGDRVAAVVMEPCRGSDPPLGFLEHIKKRAGAKGALLIFDEITIGWRLILGGAHMKLGVDPDIAVFAKSIGNGHPMAAVIGTRSAMEGAHTSFISSTYWTEGVGPAAALATIAKMREIDVPKHCADVGARVQNAWRRLGTVKNLPITVSETYPALAHFDFTGEHAQLLKTLYVQKMLERGFLATNSIYASLGHTSDVIDAYIEEMESVFGEISNAIDRGKIDAELNGAVAHTGFRRLL